MTPLHDDPHLAALLAHWQAPAPRAGAVDAILARAAGMAQDAPAAPAAGAMPARGIARQWMALAASIAVIVLVSGSWYAAHQPGLRSADTADILDENALALVFSQSPDISPDIALETF